MGSPQTIGIRAARCHIRDPALFLKDLRAVATAWNSHVICFNADMVAGRIHALAAVAQAARAFEEGHAVSNTFEMESFLFAAGSRQCNVAALFGIHEGENRLFVCCCPEREGIWTALGFLFTLVHESWDDIDPPKRDRLMRTFGITPEEIAAAGGERRLVDLVLERVALLRVNR